MKKLLIYLILLVAVLFLMSELTSKSEPPVTENLFGFITDVTGYRGNFKLDFDEARMLTGEEAIEAAILDGVCREEERENCTPNDYYIQNEIREEVEYRIANDVLITMVTYRSGEPTETEVLTIFEFQDLIEDENAHWKNLPYHLTVVDGDVTEIREQYLP
jgi:hypothetical protein